jgi:hypothetical protein
MSLLMLMPSTSEMISNCLPPPSAPHIFSSFSCGKFILLLFIRQRTPLHWSARNGHLEITRLLVESKADVAARDRCFSPPPSHHLSLTICLAADFAVAVAKLHSNAPSLTATTPTLLHTCAASARPNDAPPALPLCLLHASAPRNKCCSCSCRRCCFAATTVGRIRIGSGDSNMHAIQHECPMRCFQPRLWS